MDTFLNQHQLILTHPSPKPTTDCWSEVPPNVCRGSTVYAVALNVQHIIVSI